jgi:hypothetical protein
MWSHLSVIRPLHIYIPMHKKKNVGSTRKSVENYLLFCVLPTKFMHYTGRVRGGGTFLRQQK